MHSRLKKHIILFVIAATISARIKLSPPTKLLLHFRVTPPIRTSGLQNGDQNFEVAFHFRDLKMSTFGQYFRVTTYGESHCRSVGCIVDGCPPGMQLTEDDIQPQMTRRRPGQSALTTPRNEKDKVEIQSGTEFGVTLGTPIGLIVRNEDQRPKDYGGKTMDLYPRPSHADFTYLEKYGVKASSGGGRSSARETIGMLAPFSGLMITPLIFRIQGEWLLAPSQKNIYHWRTEWRLSPLSRQ